jgi:hypothetical protein
MEYAMRMADACLDKAMRVSPDFVQRYLMVAEALLRAYPEVPGDRFRKVCAECKVFLPKELHHNTWVSLVRFVAKLGWMFDNGKITPSERHNHMPSVTQWRSMIYDGGNHAR